VADDLFNGVLGGEDEQRETEAPQALAGAEAFAAAISAIASRQDPGVARKTEAFLDEQTLLLETQRRHLEDEHALRLEHLAHQRHLLRGQRLGQAIRIAFQIVIGLAVLVIGAGVIVMLYDAFTSRSVVIDSFDAPAALAARGVTGTVLASDVLDELTRLQHATETFEQGVKRNLSNGWSNNVKVAVPETGISLGEISRLLTARFGHDTHIGGDLVQTSSGDFVLTVRGDNVAPKTFTGGADQLGSLVTTAAQYLYSQFQPALWARYLQQAGRCPESIAFVRSIYDGTERGSRASLLATWAACLETTGGSMREAVQLMQAAIRIQPDYWYAYVWLQSFLSELGDEEGAWRAGQALLRAAGGDPGAAGARYFVVSDAATEDLQAGLEVLSSDMQANAGSGTYFLGNVWRIAQWQAQLHDPAAAELTLQTARFDDHDPIAVAGLHVARGLLAADAGDAARAAFELDAAEASLSDPRLANIRAAYANWFCQLAAAEDVAGHPDRADAVIASSNHTVDCQRFRGDILDHRGDWAGAQQVYAQAVAHAPDLPAAYYSWGAALARHGDLPGAIAKLQAANQRGPHWADPLKAWGDVLAKQDHWSDALAKYDEALKYAPNWAALQQVRATAAAKTRT
jgi:tetratricopeptide (TPR) repeat protein